MSSQPPPTSAPGPGNMKRVHTRFTQGFPGGSVVKEAAFNHWESRLPSGSRGFHPSVGKIPWRRNLPPLQFSCLENLKDTGAWRATVRGVTVRGQKEHMSACAARTCTRLRGSTPFFPLPFLYLLARKLSLHLHRCKGLHIACLRYTQRPSSREYSRARDPEKNLS